MHTLSRLAAVALLPTIGLAQDVGIADAWQEFTKTNGAGWQVQWKNADFSSLSMAVRIRLIANRAKVYSFRFAD